MISAFFFKSCNFSLVYETSNDALDSLKFCLNFPTFRSDLLEPPWLLVGHYILWLQRISVGGYLIINFVACFWPTFFQCTTVVVILPNLYCCYGDPRRRTHRVIYNATLRFPSFWTLEFQWETRVVCCSAPSSFKGCKIPSKNMVDFFQLVVLWGGSFSRNKSHWYEVKSPVASQCWSVIHCFPHIKFQSRSKCLYNCGRLGHLYSK